MFSVLNAIKDIEKDEQTAVGWLAKEYTKLYKAEPSIEQAIDDAVGYVEPALVIVLSATGAAALAPEVVAVINEAQSDLNIVSALVHDFGPTPTSASIAAGVQTELAAINTAAHFKNSATQAKFSLIVSAVGTVASVLAKAVENIQNTITTASATPIAAVAAVATEAAGVVPVIEKAVASV